MAARRGSALVEEETFISARRVSYRRVARRRWALVALIVVVVATVSGAALYLTGYLAPFARVSTLAALPAPLAPAAYTRVAVDSSGWVWVAQSAPGLARDPADTTVLTLVNPDTLWGDPVQARLCVGCPGMSPATAGTSIPAMARVDDIAPDLAHPHSLYVAGWTAATATAPGVPIALRLDWRSGARSCSARSACAQASVILAPDTPVTDIPDPAKHDGLPITAPLLRPYLQIGAQPTLALASLPNGTLYCFLSDRGQPDPHDAFTSVLGGIQTLLRYDPAPGTWTEAYVGPAGTIMAQRLGPTSTVSAMIAERNGQALYLADADHQAIFRLDLTNPALASPNPLIAATALARIAGAPLAQALVGGDANQAIPGWQGDGGPATDARLNGVRGLALDNAGDLLVSDAGNARLRLVTPKGTIATVAGRGAATVDGDGAAPLRSGLRGMLGLAAGTRGRFYLIQGAAPDGRGAIRLRQIVWGWSPIANQTARATTPGQAYASEIQAGLAAHGAQTSVVQVFAGAGCASGGCVAPYLLTAAATPYQASLAAPSPWGQTVTGFGGDPVIAAQAPGTPYSVVGVASPAELAFVPDQPGLSTPAPLPLPDGARPTGAAFLMPATDTQLATLNAAYILVATQGAPSGPALLIYKATADTCGIGVAPNGCAQFPGSPQLVATVPLAGLSSAGSVAAALSDDATHAFALVASPQENQVSAIDLTAFLATGADPMVTARVAVASPGDIALRHDVLAAYIAAGDGQLATLATSGWLSQGVPASLTNAAVTSTSLNDPATLTTRLALSSDDARLYAALQGPSNQGYLAALDTGGYGTPSAPQVVGVTATDGPALALALTPNDARLVALAAPQGSAKAGLLRAWATHDPANPDRWLDVPLDLGATPTVPDPRALVALSSAG